MHLSLCCPSRGSCDFVLCDLPPLSLARHLCRCVVKAARPNLLQNQLATG